jgi:hypothetical protein
MMEGKYKVAVNGSCSGLPIVECEVTGGGRGRAFLPC